ncbi:MAG: hypothetical protein U9O78_03030 [Patescibacteria group bacterium]|nr:hypothetical protein [Patescibacteria group bacterium]
MSDDNKTEKRVLPRSDLDFNLMTTDSVWGTSYINADLKARVTKYFSYEDEHGETKIDSESMWGLLGFYTRDMRLANLGVISGELDYCKFYLDLAGDFLQAKQVEPFLICLSRVATILELSQSKGGFLRRRMNTFTSEQYKQQLEPGKKNLFGSQGKKQ